MDVSGARQSLLGFFRGMLIWFQSFSVLWSFCYHGCVDKTPQCKDSANVVYADWKSVLWVYLNYLPESHNQSQLELPYGNTAMVMSIILLA